MATYRFAKAAPLDDVTIPDTIIQITEPLPIMRGYADLQDADAYYTAEAQGIVEALMEALPQATMHRVCQEVLRRYSSVYRGPMAHRNGNGQLQ